MFNHLLKIVLLYLLLACPFSSWAQAGPEGTQAQEPLQRGLAAARAHDYRGALDNFLAAWQAQPDSPELLFDAGLAAARLPEYELRAIALFKAYLLAAPDAPNAEAVRSEIAAIGKHFETRLGKILDHLQTVLIAYNDTPLEEWFPPEGSKLRRDGYMVSGWNLASARYYLGDAEGARQGLRATNGRKWQKGWNAQWESEAKEGGEPRHYDTGELVASMASAGLLDDALDLMDHSYSPAALSFFLEEGDLRGARKIAAYGGKGGWHDIACLAYFGTEPGDVTTNDGNHQILRAASAEAGIDEAQIKAGSCDHDLWWSASRPSFLLERGIQGFKLNYDHYDTSLVDLIAKGTAPDGNLYDFDAMFHAMAELAREYRKIRGPLSSQVDYPEAYYHRGGDYIVKGKRDRAIADFSKTIELDPKHVNAYYNRAFSYFLLQQQEAAIADYSKVIELDPKNAVGWSGRAYAYDAKGERKAAIADYTRLIDLDPKSDTYYRQRGKDYQADGQLDRAIADFSKVIERAPGDAEAYEKRGSVYELKGSLEQADADFGKAVELAHSYVYQYAETWVKRGDGLAEKGERELAIAAYGKAIGLYSRDLDAYLKRGDAYEAKGLHDLAIADYSSAIESEPESTYAFFQRGEAYKAKGENDRAIADYSKVIELDPKFAGGYTGRGSAYYEKEQYDQALTDFNVAVELDPKEAYVYGNRGLVHYQRGEFEEAIADESLALKLDPAYSDAASNRELAYQAKRSIDQLTGYSKAIEAHPQDAEAYRKRGTFYYDNGQYDQAIADFSRVIQLKKDDDLAYYSRAVAYYVKAHNDKTDTGALDRAIADYTRGISLSPDVTSYYYLASLYALKKDAEQSCLWLKKGIEGSPGTWGTLKTSLDFNLIGDAVCYKTIVDGK